MLFFAVEFAKYFDELFNKIYFEVTYEKTKGNYVTEYMYATVYLNAISRVPSSIGCVITDIIEDDEAYFNIRNTYSFILKIIFFFIKLQSSCKLVRARSVASALNTR